MTRYFSAIVYMFVIAVACASDSSPKSFYESWGCLRERVKAAPVSSAIKERLSADIKSAKRCFDNSRFYAGTAALRGFQRHVRACVPARQGVLARKLVRCAEDVIDCLDGRIFDLSRQFSLEGNPSGPWTYGYQTALGADFTPFTLSKYNYDANGLPIEVWAINSWETPAVQRNNTKQTAISDGGQGVFPPRTVWFYPGPSEFDGDAAASESVALQANYGTLRFTVPEDAGATYDLLTSVRNAYTGPIAGDTDFHVLVNNVEILGAFLSPEGRNTYDTRLLLAAGDTLDFVIGRGQDNSYHGSGLIIRATLFASDE